MIPHTGTNQSPSKQSVWRLEAPSIIFRLLGRAVLLMLTRTDSREGGRTDTYGGRRGRDQNRSCRLVEPH